jgi:hypothetical protein
MSAIRGSPRSKYEGLLPIEPPNIVFRPIDLNPIDLNPEDVPIPNGQRSAWGLRFLIVFCTGVAATLVWSGDAAREMIANSHRLFAPRPALTAQNRHPPDAIALAAPAAPSSADLDAVGQSDKIVTAPTTATSIEQAPAAKTSGVTVESQGDAASLQPAARLIEARPPQTLAEKGKPLSATSGHDGSCFTSASAALQNHPGGWPTWTLKAAGHEGTMCWYAAARPRGSDHRRGGTTENGLAAPLALRPQGWSFGLP